MQTAGPKSGTSKRYLGAKYGPGNAGRAGEPLGPALAGLVCMVLIANLQYGWTLFVRPMHAAHGWAIAGIQVAFAIFVAMGREKTMGRAFTLGALSYALLATIGSRPWAFVICPGLVFFTWGEIFSLFPATCTDLFGPKFATTNASLLYTAKGMAAWLLPLANVLKAATGSLHTVFVVSAVANLAVVACPVFVLRPARERVAMAGPVGRAA